MEGRHSPVIPPALRRMLLAAACVAGATLACMQAEVPIVPATPQVSTPLPVPPTVTATRAPPTQVTRTVSTITRQPSITPEASATLGTTAGPADTSTPTPLSTAGTIPADATLTQEFGVTHEGGTLVGRLADIADGRTITWASLRGGNAAWILSLGGSENVIGLRLYPHRDGEDTTLRLVEVSADGANWTPVYAGDGECAGVTACDILQQETWVDLAFGPVPAQFVRLRGGPTRFAIAEMQVAVVP